MLTCLKSGRYWPAATLGIARQMARAMGVTDWEWLPK